MKLKAILVSALAVCLLAMTGCGSNASSSPKTTGSSDTNTTTTTQADATQKDLSALTGFELTVIENIHTAIKPVNDLVSLASADSFDASAVKTSADAAAKSAQDYADKVKSYTLPTDMSSDTQTKVKAALDDLATSFQQRADASKACANVTSQAELKDAVAKIDTQSKDSFQSFQDKMNAIHSNLGLLDSDFSKELH